MKKSKTQKLVCEKPKNSSVGILNLNKTPIWSIKGFKIQKQPPVYSGMAKKYEVQVKPIFQIIDIL